MNEQQLVIMILGLSAIIATLGTVFVCCVNEVVIDRRKNKPATEVVSVEQGAFDAVNQHNTRQVKSLIGGGYAKIS